MDQVSRFQRSMVSGIDDHTTAELEPVRQSGSGPAGPDRTGQDRARNQTGRTVPDFYQFIMIKILLILEIFINRKSNSTCHFRVKRCLKAC
jgi:hypothetical protein